MPRPRVISAKNYQRRDNPYRLIADRGIAPIGRALAQAFKHLRTTAPKQGIANAIRAGRYHYAAHQISVDRFREGLLAPFAEIHNVYREAGQRVAKKITRQLRHVRTRKAAGGEFGFDMLDPAVIDQLSAYQDGLLQGLTSDVRETVLQAIVDGVQNGDDPETIAETIAQVIGLTPAQAQAIDNFRSMLENGDAAALSRALIDTADASAFQNAIDQGIPLDQETIDAMVANYADNMLQSRADTIARTESSRAANLGVYDAYNQAISRSVMPDGSVMRYWQIALDERTCQVCMDIPDANADGVAPDEPFDTALGPIDYPPVHPNCRCSVGYSTELDQLDQADQGDG